MSKYDLSVPVLFASRRGGLSRGYAIHTLLIYSGLIILFVKKSFFRFFWSISETALPTRPSSGTLPVIMRTTQEETGNSEKVASFLLSLGTTINMGGIILYRKVCTLFAA